MLVQILLEAGLPSWQVLGQLFHHEAAVFCNLQKETAL